MTTKFDSIISMLFEQSEIDWTKYGYKTRPVWWHLVDFDDGDEVRDAERQWALQQKAAQLPSNSSGTFVQGQLVPGSVQQRQQQQSPIAVQQRQSPVAANRGYKRVANTDF